MTRTIRERGRVAALVGTLLLTMVLAPASTAAASDAGLTTPKILTFTCLGTASCSLDGVAHVTENGTPSVTMTYTFIGTHGTFSTTTSPGFGQIVNLNGVDVWEMFDTLFSLGTPPDSIRCATTVIAIATGNGGVDVTATPHPPDVGYCAL